MPAWCWWLVLALQTLALVAFGYDKLLARLQRRRISERTLLALTFVGCLGAWGGMSLFRHKTSKPSFRWRAIALTLVNPLWVAVWWQFR